MSEQNEKLIEEAAKAIRDVREVVVPRGDGYVSVTDADDATLARAAFAVFEKAHTPTDDEREDMIAFLLRDHNFDESPWGRTYTDAEIASALRRSEVPEPSTECPQCHRPDGLHKLGCGERFGSEPQGEPSSAQEAIRVASPDTWGWDACVVCGSKDVTDRGMMVLFSAKDGVYVSRVAWCDQSQECRDDLRQAGASMLTDQDAKSIDAALRAAGGVR